MRLLRFGIIGAIATALNYAVFTGCLSIGWHYLLAAVLAWLAAAGFGFMAHRRVTFGLRGPVRPGEIGGFLAGGVAQLLLSEALYAVTMGALGLSPGAAFAVNLAVNPAFSYLVMRGLVFRTPPMAEDAA